MPQEKDREPTVAESEEYTVTREKGGPKAKYVVETHHRGVGRHGSPSRRKTLSDYFQRDGSYMGPLTALAGLLLLTTLACWAGPSLVSSMCGTSSHDMNMGRFKPENLKEDFRSGMHDVRSRLPDSLHSIIPESWGGYRDESMMDQVRHRMGYPQHQNRWVGARFWNWLTGRGGYPDQYSYYMSEHRAEKMSEDAVWQAIDRVADEMKQAAREHTHGGYGERVVDSVKGAAKQAYDTAAYPMRKAANVARGAYEGAKA